MRVAVVAAVAVLVAGAVLAGEPSWRIRPFEVKMPDPIVVLTGTTSAPEVISAKQSGTTFLATNGAFGALLPGASGAYALTFDFVCGPSGGVTVFPFGGDNISIGNESSASGMGSGTGAGGYVSISGEGGAFRVQSRSSGAWTVTALSGTVQFGDDYGVAAQKVRGSLESLRRAVTMPALAMSTASAASAPAAHELGLSFAAGATNDVPAMFILPPDWDSGLEADSDFVTIFVHYIKTTSASGTVIWQERHRLASATRDLAAWSSWTSLSNLVADGDTADRQAIDYSADISVTSTARIPARAIAVQVRRLSSGGGADTYAAAAVLLGVSLHYSSDMPGERADFAK